jgi:hypothetical protein
MKAVRRALSLCLGAFFCLAGQAWGADYDRELRELRKQLLQQQDIIERLSRQVAALQEQREVEPPPAGPTSLGKLHLSGEGGVAFFHTGSEGQFPNSEFRVDEAKLFIEAPIWDDVYVFGELNLATREEPNEHLWVGELYLEFENISRLWKRDGQMNLRIGRLDIPFGDEYLTRDAIDHPLISHSLSDIWGVDEGVELFGAIGKLHYVLALQNGGHSSLRDFEADKSVAGRLSYDPFGWLHLSASAMRTGGLNAEDDFLSELWFGNGFVRSIGSLATTTTFEAQVYEGDIRVRLPGGHLHAAGGYLRYDDNDTAADNRRDVYYYYVEALHQLTKKLYAAARWSHILAADGFPLVGHGDFTEFLYYDLTKDLWRLSLGFGYRWSPNLLFKAEYTFEQGTKLDGTHRLDENFLSAEVAFKF